MDLDNLKKLVEKGVKGSGEKQLKVFLKNRKTSKYFKEAMSSSAK